MTTSSWRPGARRSTRLLILAVVVLGAAAARPPAAAAHALLRASDPASGATLGSAPASIVLTFSEAPDPRLSSIKVLDSSGTDHASGPVEAMADPADSIRVPVGSLGDGVYTVSWRTVSSVDGHVAVGSFAFGVGVAPPAGPAEQPKAESGSAAAVLARWLLYIGVALLLGAAFTGMAVARGPAANLLVLAALGWVVTAVGTLSVVGVQWLEAGVSLESVLGTSIGIAAIGRVVALVLVGGALAVLAVAPRRSGARAWSLVFAAAAIVLGADVVFGHAAAGRNAPFEVAGQWLHGLFAGVWMGGLAGLLAILPITPAADRVAAARRYSFWAAIALVIVAGTGAVRAIDEVGTLEALVTTDFGRVVLGKSVVIFGIAALGAFNRFITLRNAARVLGGLRRIGGAELTLAFVVFGLSGLLVNLTPPTSAGSEQAPVAQPIVATGNDFGTSVRARLVITPGSPGANRFDFVVSDYDTGQPLDAGAVSLRLQLASQQGIAPATMPLERTAVGTFSGSGAALAIDGIWQITATVTLAGAPAVEIPLVAATTVPAQPYQTSVSPGLPTIYIVQLGEGRTVQVYLDPGGPGENELHVTFFDADGNELPTQSATIAAFPAGGGGSILAPRMLEAGHFVTTIDAVPGALAVDAVSPLPDPGAGLLHVHVTIEVSP